MQLTTNLTTITNRMLKKLSEVGATDQLLRTVASNMLPEVKQRIHVHGQDSTGGQIGNYSEGYMRVRTGNFKNAERFSRGKNKGQLKNAGRFTKGKNLEAFDTNEGDLIIIGQVRPRFNRTSDTKVVISLTRQMENDFSVIATSKGYGLGYKNPENALKVDYVEETYKKKIFALSPTDKEKVREIAKNYVTTTLRG
jgi:phage gpG-like protein